MYSKNIKYLINFLGLSKGYMYYAIDPILPVVKQSIRNSVQKINQLPLSEF